MAEVLRSHWSSGPFDLVALPEIAGLLAHQFSAGDVVALSAPMGTGKTTLVSAIAEVFGCVDRASSPTFSLVQEYPLSTEIRGVQRIHHVDLYRISDPREFAALGLEDVLNDPESLVFVEWPERAPGHFSPQDWLLKMSITEDGCRIAELLTSKFGEVD